MKLSEILYYNLAAPIKRPTWFNLGEPLIDIRTGEVISNFKLSPIFPTIIRNISENKARYCYAACTLQKVHN